MLRIFFYFQETSGSNPVEDQCHFAYLFKKLPSELKNVVIMSESSIDHCLYITATTTTRIVYYLILLLIID